MNAFAEFIDTLVTGFSFSGNDIYIFGGLGVQTDVVQADNSSPRNVIDLYYQPLSVRAIDFLTPQFAAAASANAQSFSSTTKSFIHPKFDRQLFQRKHRYVKGWRNQSVEKSERP